MVLIGSGKFLEMSVKIGKDMN